MSTIRHYTDSKGRDIFTEWMKKIRDANAKVAIRRRLTRMAEGNFGDHKPIRNGVWELRIDVGPGYRAYYAREGATII